MKKMVLDDLLKAIHNSVLKTQQLTEEQYFRVLRRYFDFDEDNKKDPDKWGSPKTITMKLPVIKEDKLEYQSVEVPAIALVPPSGIKIKKMKVSFETSLDGFRDEGAGGKKGFSLRKLLKKEGETIDEAEEIHGGPITLKMGRTLFGGQKAKIEIEFESCEQPETVARINDRIVSKLPF